MLKKYILVPEINVCNFSFFLFLSFFYKIRAYEIQSVLLRILKSRIKLLNIAKYLDWEDCVLIRDQATAYWEKNIQSYFPTTNWNLNIANTELNMAKKAKSDFQIEIEKLFFLNKIANCYISNKLDTYIIHSLKMRYLSRIDKDRFSVFRFKKIDFLTLINIQFDRLHLLIKNCLLSIRLVRQLFYGISHKINENRKYYHDIKCIFDGISPRELSVNNQNCVFAWIVDDVVIRKEQVLFLLPKPDFQMKHFSDTFAKEKGYLISNDYDIASYASFRDIMFCLFETTMQIFVNVLLVKVGIERLMKMKYAIKILKWVPVVKNLKPEVYITSVSAIGREDPVIIYLQKKRIKTAIWMYGTNSYLFINKDVPCKFRNIRFCDIISSTILVWNNHFKDFVETHVQEDLEVVVIGPLMAGDESVLYLTKKELVEKIGFESNDSVSNVRYISFFDVPSVSNSHKGSTAFIPDSNTEEYNYFFIKDVCKLLKDFSNIVLVYKPKRSVNSGKFSYSKELQELFEYIRNHPRVKILDYNINPWIPIALADLTISMPFESPFIASLHYGKYALFHDPLNIASYHRYTSISDYISHSYIELKSKVAERLLRMEENEFMLENSKVQKYVGIYHGTNSSDRFRKYLSSTF